MSEEVLFRIKGLHELIDSSGDDEAIEVTAVADYYEKDGVHYVFYDEMLEGVETPIKNRVKIDGDSVTLIKKGGITTELMFGRDRQIESTYMTPFGSITMTTDTKELNITEDEKGISCSISYGLSMNYAPVADCKIDFSIIRQ